MVGGVDPWIEWAGVTRDTRGRGATTSVSPCVCTELSAFQDAGTVTFCLLVNLESPQHHSSTGAACMWMWVRLSCNRCFSKMVFATTSGQNGFSTTGLTNRNG